ncbi:hypothetical protein [Candidatus Colwellia aromaticivorans]|uniref:hypothetical protein n=1 Tax=Candidatus Colwellia aromaticivorans TaxID=2267621 RepID=UPI001443F5CF|nr:hypothetical protein [Candidatus Colwellia aromaticivorans]
MGIASDNAVYIARCLVDLGSMLAASVSIMIMIELKALDGLFLIYFSVEALRARNSSY